jgi:hypothetical protein
VRLHGRYTFPNSTHPPSPALTFSRLHLCSYGLLSFARRRSRSCACARVLGFGVSRVRVRRRLRLRSKWLVGRLRHSSPSCSLCLPTWPMSHLLFEPALTRVSPFVPDPAHTHPPIHSTSPSLLASHSLVVVRTRLQSSSVAWACPCSFGLSRDAIGLSVRRSCRRSSPVLSGVRRSWALALVICQLASEWGGKDIT